MTLIDSYRDDDSPALAPAATHDISVRRATISLVVVDPHAPVREGLPLLLAPSGIDVVATAATGDGAEAVIGQHEPDVALVALDLADVDGVVLLARLAQRGIRSAVVLYTDDDDPQQAAVALHGGAAGVIAKRRSIAELTTALRAVAAGRLWFDEPGSPPSSSPRPSTSFLSDLRERRTSALSGAELRVLSLVAEGSSTEEAAALLTLSPHTVRTHLRNVMRKLEASSRAHAVAIAIREAAIEV